MSKAIRHHLHNFFPIEHRWKIPLLVRWDEVIGSLKSKVVLEKVTADSLLLRVEHSSWAQEIYMLIPLLKKKINAILGENKIKHIRFKTGFSSSDSQQKQTTYLLDKNHEKKIKPSPQMIGIHEAQVLEKVESEELRDVLAQFCLRCKQIRKE